MSKRHLSGAAASAAIALLTWQATAADLSDYTVKKLLEPCIEGDADSRWGAAAEAECEQYIRGFTDAYLLVSGGGKADNVCLPAQNRDDEIRWAFMKWAHRNLDQRSRPAAEGLLATIKAVFKCK
jgi:hypothetical protein